MRQRRVAAPQLPLNAMLMRIETRAKVEDLRPQRRGDSSRSGNRTMFGTTGVWMKSDEPSRRSVLNAHAAHGAHGAQARESDRVGDIVDEESETRREREAFPKHSIFGMSGPLSRVACELVL